MNRIEKIKARSVEMLRAAADIEVRIKEPLPPAVPSDMPGLFRDYWQRTRLQQIANMEQNFPPEALLDDDRTQSIAEVASVNVHAYVQSALITWMIEKGWVERPTSIELYQLLSMSMSACVEILLVTRSSSPPCDAPAS